jgi:pyrroline-5-carboxylate reductase
MANVRNSLLVVGGGNMGASLVGGVLGSGLFAPSAVTIVEPSRDRVAELSRKLAEQFDSQAVNFVSDVSEVTLTPDVVLLAVKPQIASAVCVDYAPLVAESTLVLSCMAGKTIAFLASIFTKTTHLVRFMPNLPAQIGKSMSVYIAHEATGDSERQFARRFLACSGEVLEVASETLLDAATAVSGSGTGYIAYFLEHMVAQAQKLGFSYEESCTLVAKTMEGAVALWQHSGVSPEELRLAVTSPGGTTAAAIASFDEHGVGLGVQAGMEAAFARSREL